MNWDNEITAAQARLHVMGYQTRSTEWSDSGMLRWSLVADGPMGVCERTLALDAAMVGKARFPEDMLGMELTRAWWDLVDAVKKRSDGS